MQKKKILLPLLLLAPAFLAHQVYADEQVASEPSQEVAAVASAQEGNVQMELLIQAHRIKRALPISKVICLKQILSIQMTFTAVLLKKKELLETLN